MKQQIKELKGEEKRIYILSFKRSLDKVYSEDKEKLLHLWDLLESLDFAWLKSVGEGFEFEEKKERFYYPEEFKTELTTKTVFMHSNKDRAEKSFKAFEHAKKVGIISPKKKS